MKTIAMTLGPKSIRDAIRELKKYRDDLQQRCAKACRRLGELGVVSAWLNYSAVATLDDDFTVLPVQGSGTSYRVVASGKDVAFVEFGTGEGVAYPAGYPRDGFADKVYSGSWSQENDGMFAKNGYWYYKGQKMYGERAGMPMYLASQEMRENIASIFREEFK